MSIEAQVEPSAPTATPLFAATSSPISMPRMKIRMGTSNGVRGMRRRVSQKRSPRGMTAIVRPSQSGGEPESTEK